MAVDDSLAMIGSANMEYRSFDLNLEVNAVIYRKEVNAQLKKVFENDLKDSVEIDSSKWMERPKYLFVWEKFVRLLSPFL